MFGQDCRWKRKESDSHQEQQIRYQKWTIDASDVFKQRMVIDPHNADDEKAEDIANVARPSVPKGGPEPSSRVKFIVVGYLDFQHKQCDSDCKDAVAKCLQPVCRRGACRVHVWIVA